MRKITHLLYPFLNLLEQFYWIVFILIYTSIITVKIETENARFISVCSFQLAILDTCIKCSAGGGFLFNIIEYDTDNKSSFLHPSR